MTWLLSLLPDIGPWILGFIVVLGTLLGFRRSGVKAERTRNEAKQAKDNLKTRERMDNAKIVGDDPAAAREWLRERGKR